MSQAKVTGRSPFGEDSAGGFGAHWRPGENVSTTWNRPQTWLALIVAAVGGLITFIGGLHLYITATATPLHPEPDKLPTAAGSPPPATWADAVARGRRVAHDAVVQKNLPGLSVAVGADGQIIWAEGFGWADLEDRVPVTPQTRFRIGTASPVLTSAAVGLLLEKGQLKLDEPIQTYVPAFPEKRWPVTLRQVMAHQAGIGTDSGDEGPLYGRRCERPVDAFEVFAHDDLRFQPGTSSRHSAFGWIVVSAAVEWAAGEPFGTFMRKAVFDPLGMDGTRLDAEAQDAPNRATPYFPRYAADPRYGPDPMREIDLSCYAGAGAYVSTPSDLVRFGLALQGGQLLQPATVQVLHTAQKTAAGLETRYGLGWDVKTATIGGRHVTIAGLDGDVLGGPVASFLIVRDRGLVVAVLSNTSYADPFAIATGIADAFAAAGPATGTAPAP